MASIENIKLVQIIIALLAIAALASPKPSLSAIFLFFESLVINITLYFSRPNDVNLVAGSILLTFFITIIICSNIFLNISHTTSHHRSPKLNITSGAFLLALFWLMTKNFSTLKSDITNLNPLMWIEDSLSLIMIGFALLVIVVAALSVLDIKKTAERDTRHDF